MNRKPPQNILSSPRLKYLDFPVVAIGSSAGGLEALELFFSNMPDNTGMAFVLIQDLDPNHKGMMPDLASIISSRLAPFRNASLVCERIQ